MAGTVMQPLTGAGGMRAKWRDGRPMKKVAGSIIKPNDRLTSFERLEIYNLQYWYRIKDSFFEDYPGLRAILGEQRFERLALAYIEQRPSESAQPGPAPGGIS
jgi:putative DNA-binding protein